VIKICLKLSLGLVQELIQIDIFLCFGASFEAGFSKWFPPNDSLT
jgi:hypothetical protein